MPIPDFQTIMRPLLVLLADDRDHVISDLTSNLSDHFDLTDEERAHRLRSGSQTLISNRVGWAKSHLKIAGLIEQPSRGIVRITPAGRKVLEANPERVGLKVLRTIPAYQEAAAKWGNPPEGPGPETNADNGHDIRSDIETPRERIDAAHKLLRAALAKEVLDKVNSGSPAFFEELVVQLLLKMGYGGTREDAGKRIGRGGDGGIDGIINEDRLGLDVVCIQAKRWDSTVGRPVVQAFVGSLDYYRSRKGVLITTASFSKDARDYVDRIEGKKVVLIDGETLADLMIEYNIGVSVAETYQLKRVDHDFFSEELD